MTGLRLMGLFALVGAGAVAGIAVAVPLYVAQQLGLVPRPHGEPARPFWRAAPVYGPTRKYASRAERLAAKRVRTRHDERRAAWIRGDA